MSCSRVSVFLAATAIRRYGGLHVVARPRGRRGRGRRRSRPRRCRPRRGRRRRASCGCRSAAAGRRRTRPAWSRRSGWWRGARRRARPGRPARGRGRSCRSAGSSRPATSRTASSSMVTTCGKASRKKPRDPHGHVDARPAQLGQRDRLQADDPARRLVPDRPDAEQREHLGDVVAGGAHRRGAPHRQPDRLRPVARVGAVARQQRVGHRLHRSPTPAGTGPPWGRRSRSCGRSAAR